jgi:hypothetical protein
MWKRRTAGDGLPSVTHRDPLVPGDGYRALLAHNADGLVAWNAFLTA